MAAIRDDIKQGCADTGHSLADLARQADIHYPRLSGFVNGYWRFQPEEECRIRKIIESWRTTPKGEKC